MNNRGFTLLEMMMAVAIFTVVIGVLFSLSLGFANAAELQEIRISNMDEARRVLYTLTPMLRQAARTTVNRDALPGDVLSFQVARDLNGNGFAVDETGSIELGDLVVVRRNPDNPAQLILIEGANAPEVLANHLQQGAAPTDTTTLGAGEIPDGVGFWVSPRDVGYDVTVQIEGVTRRGRVYTTAITEHIVPRNTN